MNAGQSDPKEGSSRLMAHLRKYKNDRGAMANLRCALNQTKLPRAWPLLGPIGGIGNERLTTVAGLYAYHPDETQSGNIGTTCRTLQANHSSFEARFQRLLGCDRDEICERLRPVILAAKAKGIRVNYEQLYVDLCWWETAKVRWAQEYWGTPKEEEDISVPVEEAAI
jgi:CRISPR system Cascade subunit CasB